MKFLIVTTRSKHGGNLVLRELCQLLAQRGHDARIISFTVPDFDHPTTRVVLGAKSLHYWMRDCGKRVLGLLGCKKDAFGDQRCRIQRWPFIGSDTIVVYPEVVYGNPLRAQKVVRWFLYHNRYPGDANACGTEDLIFSFREYFNDYKLNPTCRLLLLNHFNADLYKQTNFGERKGNCYIVRKGGKRKDLPAVFDGPIVDDLPEKEKVAVFNRCKYCYDYDTQTFYATIAAACGCIPVVVMEPGKTKEDYLGKGERSVGRAYGNNPEEIEMAIRTRGELLKWLDSFSKANERNIDHFLKEVEHHFGKTPPRE